MDAKIKCQKLNSQGKGIFQFENKMYACSNLLPNEEAIVEINKNQVKLKQIIKPSPDRQKVLCDVFDRCGGCEFQHLSNVAQNDFKMSYIQDLFPQNKIESIITMDDPTHYRHKVIATFSTNNQKKIIAGIYEEDSHHVCPVNQCRIQHNEANKIIDTIVKLANEFRYSAYNEDKKTGLLRHCLIRVSHYYEEVLVCLVVSNTQIPGSKNFINKLRQIHPNIKTVVFNINNRSTSVVLGNEEKIAYGTGMVKDKLCNLDFLISSKTFYQINPIQTEKLYHKAIELAQLSKEDTVLDAYCGIGTISLIAAKACKEVVGVEINPTSIKNAISNAKTNQIKNAFFITKDCGQYMLQVAQEKKKFDCVIMDPAREGSDENFLNSLIKLNPTRIVYISCGPETQKRDIQLLTKAGYKIKKVQPVDLFPYTIHVENICLLER